MIPTILTLNAGSSSLKFRVFTRNGLKLLARGAVNNLNGAAELVTLLGTAEMRLPLPPGAGHAEALSAVLDWVDTHDKDWRMDAIAHRIVHGGMKYSRSVPVTPQVMTDLENLIPLAPLHQPYGLAAVRASQTLLPDAPDIACFDTAFHAGRSDLFTRFALPQEFHDRGVRRYGFHGLSYAWLSNVLETKRPDLHAGRVVAAHLGNGASLCAMVKGRSIDTSMGMTAVDGVPMGTRSGAIDPGAVLILQRSFGLSVADLEALIYNQSGLLALSGSSNDVAGLLAEKTETARFALDVFALRCAQAAATLAVSLGGIDAMIFTGGIGEHAEPVREKILKYLGVLGGFEVLVIPANEEKMMAMEAVTLLEKTE